MARKFYNRRWKSKDNELEICQDIYTPDELNVIVGLGRDAVSTMIKKSSLLSFANGLENRNDNIYSADSNYADMEYFKAQKTENGYKFFVKGIFERAIELPFQKVDKIIQFLKFNCT